MKRREVDKLIHETTHEDALILKKLNEVIKLIIGREDKWAKYLASLGERGLTCNCKEERNGTNN